jgi:biotin transport system substrate-specific component
MVTCALFGAATCVLAPISVPIPVSPVPITLSVFIILLSGAFLPPRSAFYSQLIRIAAGLIGMPVFANYQAGPGFIIGPLGGYLIVSPVMALLVSLAARPSAARAKPPFLPMASISAAMAAAVLLCYLVGTVWLSLVSDLPFIQAVWVGVIPFIPLDIVKIVMACVVYATIGKRVGTMLKYN